MTIAIIDDCESDQHRIARYTERFLQEQAIPPPYSYFYPNGEAFITKLSPHFFDLVMLDCIMPGKSGLETAEELRKKDKEAALIFVSSSCNYAIDGYFVDACGYLVKPYTYEAFSHVFKSALKHLPDRHEAVVIHDGGEKRRIPVNAIVFCDIDGHYSQIHLCNSQVVRMRMAFLDITAILAPYTQFFECYRGCIINMDHVRIADEMNFLMDTGERLPYRKKDQHIIKRKYSDYVLNKV